MSINIFQNEKDLEKYFYVTYYLETTKTLREAAYALAVGQSIGNPNLRSGYETPDMIEDFCAKIVNNISLNWDRGNVEVGFPLANIDWQTDGISHLLCTIMGGQTDIDIITKCRALRLEFNDDFIKNNFNTPKYGISGIRNKSGNQHSPLFGGIIKPKTGMTPDKLLDMVKELVEGGVNFIKEDEIMSNPAVCRLSDRIDLINNYISNTNVVYCYCINSDPSYILPRAQFVANNGGNGVHINVWSGLGSYKTIRDANLPLFIHYQKSGDKAFTHKDNPFSLSWELCCQLAVWCGVDSIHAGMWGGYLSDPEDELRTILNVLQTGNVLPALSCGMTADLIQPIVDKFGIDWMANVGGAIHSDPSGSKAGALKIKNAINNLT